MHQIEPLWKKDLFKIIPDFNTYLDDDPSHDLFIHSIELHLEKILPKEFKEKLQNASSDQDVSSAYDALYKQIPFYHYTYSQREPHTLSISFLNYSEYTSGAGRYILDTLCRWLIPGKSLSVTGARILSFRFAKSNLKSLLYSQYLISIPTSKELGVALKNIDQMLKEISINIMAVYYARYIVSMKSLTIDQKASMVKNYITTLLPKNGSEDVDIHDQMQEFLIKLSNDQKYVEIKKNLSFLVSNKPKSFDGNVFHEIRHFMVLFRDKFTMNREPKHISRVIAFQYLFKKNIIRQIQKAPDDRHISLKILKTHVKSDTSNQMVLGVLIAVNFLRDTERFDKRHVLEAIKTYIPEISYVKDSYILERSDENIRSIYLEVEKKNRDNFSFEEIKELKIELPKEIKERIENVAHPIFMPRNEEEIMRNIIVLSKQLKYVRDIPQVIINFDKQTDQDIIFNLILVRLIKHTSRPLKQIFSTAKHLNFLHEETKVVGYLKRKYPKEVNLFRIYLDKSKFFRKDFSLDLQKARRHIVHELTYLIGEFRDYNGGMIVKQSEALDHLRLLMEQIGKRGEFLLENFFYSLRPAVMQSILSTKVMKSMFMLLLDAIEEDFSMKPYYLKFHIESNYLITMMSTPSAHIKERVQNNVAKLKIAGCDLTSSLVNIYEITTLGYAYRFEDIEQVSEFKKTVKQSLDDSPQS